MTGRVHSLHIYPMKSAAALDVKEARVTVRGLEGDRRWMLIDSEGTMLSARTHPRLLTVRAEHRDGALQLSTTGQASLAAQTPGGAAVPVEIWGQHTTGRDAGDDAARWFTELLGIECRLVYQAEEDHRPVKPRPSTREGDLVSFADGYPLLLIGTASLAALNARVPREVKIGMNRFRPNVVVETRKPFEEDRWGALSIGEVEFVNAKPCARCVLTTFDPETARRDPDREPLRTLATFRRAPDNNEILFGTNLVPRSAGSLRVGDSVRPLLT